MKLYPLKFQPISKYRIWGGNKLNSVLKKGFEGENLGESWEISDVKGDETKVANGPLKDKTLKNLAHEYKDKFLGERVFKTFGVDFPLLIKFIDAKRPLSVQVHPHDEVAKQRHESFGKNEMWYIMDADESSELIIGFKQPSDKSTYSKHLMEGSIIEVLNKEKVKPGDAVYIPTGRVHAIGAGVLLAEIQQTSDITYRIYDYDRVDKASGKQRDLHKDLAMDVIDFKTYDDYLTTYNKNKNTTNVLINTPYFKSNFLKLDKELVKDYSKIDSFVIFICTAGALKISIGKDDYTVNYGETILLPACLNHIELIPLGETELLEVYY